MEKITITVEWDGLQGPHGPQDIRKIFESHYKNDFKVRRLNFNENQRFQKLTYSVEEAAALLGLSRATTYSLVNQKQIPGIQYGKRWIIPKAALEKQLGGSIPQKDNLLINEIDRSELLATTNEALQLYDLLRAKMISLVKNISKRD